MGLDDGGRVGGMAGKRRLTPKVKAFMAAYGGEARCNASEAARLVFGKGGMGPGTGVRSAQVIGAEMRRKWPELMEEAEERFKSRFQMSDDELDEHLSEISRDKQHKDRLRALELIARMKGRLNDKLKVEIDRKSMLKEIEMLLQVLPVPAPTRIIDADFAEEPAQKVLKAIN
jgi:hypothetical protein